MPSLYLYKIYHPTMFSRTESTVLAENIEQAMKVFQSEAKMGMYKDTNPTSIFQEEQVHFMHDYNQVSV